MINKRIMFILILLIVAIGAVSHVSAEDVNGTQQLAIDDIEVTQSNDIYSSDDATITPINLEGKYQTGVATVKLTDSNNNPLSNQRVKLTVVYKTSGATPKMTDENGIASFEFKDLFYYDGKYVNSTWDLTKHTLTVGNWPIKIDLDGGDYTANTVNANLNVLKTTANININDMTADFGEDKYFEMTLTDSDTGKPIKGEVFKIQITSEVS